MRAADIDATYGYYNVNDDESRPKMSDTRKQRLTLRHLNKIKKIRATRRLEMLQRSDVLELIYGQAEEQGGGGGMF